MSGSPHMLLTVSHFTSATYIRSHCTISLLIWWQRVRSMDSSRTGRPNVCDADERTGTEGCRDRICADAANADAEETIAEEDDMTWRWGPDALDMAGWLATACGTWGAV